MARTLIVSDRNNSFFTANNIKVGTEIPTSGTYSKGDIVVNIGNNTATEAMWICVEAGTPGTWEVVGAGAGGGSGSIVAINDTVTVNNSVTEVSLGNLVGKISSSDKLIVHYNSTHLMEGVDYKVNSEGTRIVKLTEGSWNESGEQALFAFELFKNVESVNGNEIVIDTKLTSIVNNIMIPAPTTEVEIGVEGFDKNNDTLLVFKNGVIMVEGIDYNVNEDNTKIISINEVWNESNVEEYGITFVVFKEVVIYDGATGGITMGMLGSDVRETINNLTETTLQHSNLLEDMDGKYATKEDLGNIEVDLSPYQQKIDNNLQTSSKDVVGAINELFQSANNGKELIANAIGEPVSADDTFSAMSNDINGLLATFKTNMMNNGITVDAGDRFKSLIDKIATLADNEGKGVQFVQGTSTVVNTLITYTKVDGKTNGYYYIEIPNLTFEPLFIIAKKNAGAAICFINASLGFYYSYYNTSGKHITLHTYGDGSGVPIAHNTSGVTSIDFTNIKLPVDISNTGTWDWYAIGVGEEDTTLRDSLASILQEEGVSVTEEDDMASLITKVDEEFEDTRNTLAGLMQAGGYDVKGNEDTDTLLGLLTASGIEINSIKQISCGFNHILLLKNDGSVWACGRNNYGQLGLGTSGDNTNQTTFTQVTKNINNDVKHIYCGHYHSFIIKNDGSLWACGQNYNGQLGLGNTTGQSVFTQVTTNINNDVKQVAGGNNHTMILKNDGSLWACGYNRKGQLGLGTIDSNAHNTFTQVTTNINNDVKQVACGDQHNVILKNDGSVWSCGYNSTGQLGMNDSSDRPSFTKVTTNINNDVKEVHCGHESTFIIKNDGSLWATGNNAYGQLGLGNTNHKSTFTQVTVNASDIKQIACGSYHTFILKNDGSLYSCGWNQGGLGVTDTYADLYSSFTLISGGDHSIRSVDCGYGFSYVIKNNGELWSCGYNDYGNLGLGHKTTTWSFTYLTPIGKTF